MGIVFYRTTAPEDVIEFYTGPVGAEVWLEQPGCTIVDHHGFRLGFCEGDAPETEGTITFVYPHREGVDAAYGRLEGRADGEPRVNGEYRIYQFFADDPEGRTLEFQTFE